MPERFAIFYAPAPASALRKRAVQWLGRDEMTGGSVSADISGIDPLRRGGVTQSPRRYGFHATLKPPMRLSAGRTRERLVQAVTQFAMLREPVAIGRLTLKSLGGFLALVPERQDEALTAFAAECVTGFEAFRAPPDAEERARRLAGGLTQHQVDLLDRLGYPYVLDQFQFHMTLTDKLRPEQTEQVTAAAMDWFAPVLGEEVVLDRIALFHEPARGLPFLRIVDFPLFASS